MLLWQREWTDKWHSYGPKSLLSGADTDAVAKQSIHVVDDLHRHTRITHWDDLATPFFHTLHVAMFLVFELVMLIFDLPVTETAVDLEPPRKRQRRTAEQAKQFLENHGQTPYSDDWSCTKDFM